jgi:methylglutaconyl-CoA hydratase
MGEERLMVKTQQGFASLLSLNRPKQHNALSKALLADLGKAIEECWHDSSVRVVMITGEGPSFCAGADLKERAQMPEEEVARFVSKIRNTLGMLQEMPKPVIALINGGAFGGGLEMALACDIRIAAEGALMGLTETSLGIIPGAGGTQRLPRVVGVAKAKELIFTARRVDAREAHSLGLVNMVVPKDRLLDTGWEMAQRIAKNGPIAVAMAKEAINRGSEVDISTGLAIEARCYDVVVPTEDRLEGLAAFKEKREPRYKGR